MQVFQIKNNYLQHQRTHTMDKAVHLPNLLNGNRPIIFYLLLTSFTSSLAKLEISSLFIFVFLQTFKYHSGIYRHYKQVHKMVYSKSIAAPLPPRPLGPIANSFKR